MNKRANKKSSDKKATALKIMKVITIIVNFIISVLKAIDYIADKL